MVMMRTKGSGRGYSGLWVVGERVDPILPLPLSTSVTWASLGVAGCAWYRTGGGVVCRYEPLPGVATDEEEGRRSDSREKGQGG